MGSRYNPTVIYPHNNIPCLLLGFMWKTEVKSSFFWFLKGSESTRHRVTFIQSVSFPSISKAAWTEEDGGDHVHPVELLSIQTRQTIHSTEQLGYNSNETNLQATENIFKEITKRGGTWIINQHSASLKADVCNTSKNNNNDFNCLNRRSVSLGFSLC